MLDTIKKMAVNMLTGAAATTALLLIGVGYSDLIDPAAHPKLACVGMLFPFFLIANLIMMFVMLIVQWKRLWVPILGFVLAYGPTRTYIPLHIAGEKPEHSLLVLSYNVCGYGGNYRYEKAVDTITAYVQRLNPDIVCLQEDHGGKGGNPVKAWEKIYPYNDTTHVNIPEAKTINAIGIHTRYPIIRKERIPYPAYANGSVAYFLQTGHDTLIVINNHLEHTHLTTADREHYRQVIKGDMEHQAAEEQARHLIDKLAEGMALRAYAANVLHQYVADHARYPIILCGDFNDTPISYARRTISQSLTDCFVESGCGLGLSYNQKGFNFRIDHMMCSYHFEPYGCTVDNEMDASDHYPIFCQLKTPSSDVKKSD